MRIHRVGPWVVIAVALAIGGCKSTVGNIDDPCAAMLCAGDETCDAGTCIKLPSCLTSTCPPGSTCMEGVCSSCTTNVHCSVGYARCDMASSDCAKCASDSDCSGALSHCGPSGCVQCTSDAQCPAGAPHCSDGLCHECAQDSECAANATCVGGKCAPSCGSDSQCPADSPRCYQGHCVGCESSADCGSGLACYGNQCRPAYPGDSCPAAEFLDLSAGSITVAGDLFALPIPESDPYNYDPAQDAFYTFTVSSDSTVDATLDWDSFRTSMSMTLYAGRCDELHPLASGGSTLAPTYLAPGTYLLRIVNQSPSLSGAYVLHVRRVDTAPQAPGTTCLKPAPFSLGVPGTVTLHQDLTGLPQPLGSECQVDGDDPAFVWAFDVPEQAFYDFDLTPSAGLQARMAFHRDECWGPPETPWQGCVGNAPGKPTSLHYVLLEPGRHVVAVSAENNTTGSFDLAIRSVLPVPNPTCQTALPLVFDGGVAVLANDPNYSLGGPTVCGNSPDAVTYFAFSTVGLGERSLWVDSDTTGATFAITSSCDEDGGTRVGCGYGYGDSPIDQPRLPEGNYYLSTWGTASTVVATLGPAYPVPANDTCATAQVIALDAGTVTVSGDSRGANDDNYQCDGTASRTRDVTYLLAAPGRGRLSVSVTPTDPDFVPALEMENSEYGNVATCNGFGALHCAAPDAGSSSASWSGLTDHGTAYASVDSLKVGGGTFQLTASYTAPPANDLCSSPQTITAGSTVSGDISVAFQDIQGCYWSNGVPGADLFFKYTQGTSAGNVTVTLTPNGFDGRLAVQTSCTSTCVLPSPTDSAGIGGTETLTFAAAKNTSYYIVVGQLDPGSLTGTTTGGSFTLSVQ